MTKETAPAASSLVGAVAERNAEGDSLHGGGSAAKADKRLSVQKNKSDGSLKDGFLATAQAVHAVGHKAKEAIKEACVMGLRPQSSHPTGAESVTGCDVSSQVVPTNSSSLPRPPKNVVAPLQISASQSDVSVYSESTLHTGTEGPKHTWPRSSPSVSPGGSSTFPRSARRPSGGVAEAYRTGVSPVRKAAGGSVSTRDIKKFIKAFPEVSAHDEEHLEAIYSCALDREGLWHGKMFLTSQHLCFSGTHFTKSAKIILSYPEITGVQKKNSGGMFPNALRMTVDPDRKYVFTAFLKRDSAYADIMNLWRNVVSPLTAAEQAAAFADEVHDADAAPNFSDGSLSHSPTGGAPIHSMSAPYIVYPDEDSESDGDVLVKHDDGNGAIAEAAAAVKAADMQEEVRENPLEPVADMSEKLAAPLGRLRASNSEPDISHLAAAGQVLNSPAPLLGTGPLARPNRASTTIASGIGFIKKMLPGERARSDSTPTTIEQALAQLVYGDKTTPPSNDSARSQQGSPSMAGPRGKLLRRISQKRSAAGTVENTSNITIKRVPEDDSQELGGSTADSITTIAVVSTIARPTAPVNCDCPSHLEYEAVDTVLSLDVEDLFAKIFISDPELIREAHRRRDTHDVVFDAWTLDPQTNHPVSRDVSYTVSYKPPMLSKQTAGGFEKQTVLKYVARSAYVVECTVKTPKAPYGEFFSPVTRYCITHAGPGKARLKVTVKVDFTKRLMWKSQIESATAEGMKGYCAELVKLLKSSTTAANAPEASAVLSVAVGTVSADPLNSKSAATGSIVFDSPRKVYGDMGSLSRVLSFVASAFRKSRSGPAANTSDSATAATASHAARQRREKRTAIAALSTLALLLLLGVAITAMNMYWMVAVGRRLDHTISGLERVKDLMASKWAGAEEAITPPAIPNAALFHNQQQLRNQARAKNLEKAHEKLERMHAALNTAHRRAANLANSITDANARIQESVAGLDGLLSGPEFSQVPQNPVSEQEGPLVNPGEPTQSKTVSDLQDESRSPPSQNEIASPTDSPQSANNYASETPRLRQS
ncbi:hypothetical protein HDU86_005192 [Geranomyces michiganensis]|nr:hypothetical protein HDU86_005192 [Geranomyces michiganensis]